MLARKPIFSADCLRVQLPLLAGAFSDGTTTLNGARPTCPLNSQALSHNPKPLRPSEGSHYGIIGFELLPCLTEGLLQEGGLHELLWEAVRRHIPSGAWLRHDWDPLFRRAYVHKGFAGTGVILGLLDNICVCIYIYIYMYTH